MRLVFMGTPEFGIPTFQKLLKSRHEIVCIVTRPDRPKGRGLKTAGSAIKTEAVKSKLPFLQPENLRDEGFIHALTGFSADCFVVIGFRILPFEVFSIPPKGTINLHASLLPKYRGAAPIQWSLINGEQETGISVFFIEEKVDTGKLILQARVPINEDDDAGSLHDKLAVIGADSIITALDLIEQDHVRQMDQRGIPTRAPKILPEHCQIHWNQPARQIVNLIRGLSPFPGAFTTFHGKRLKIFKANILNEDSEVHVQPGMIVEIQKTGITVAAQNGNVVIRELQVEGKRRMKVDDFLRGCQLSVGFVFK